MSVSDTYFRHNCILRKLQKGPASLEEIKDFYELECETHGYKCSFSRRTFLRDKMEIFSLHKKDILFDFSAKKYHLDEDDEPDRFGERITDAFNTYLALNMADSISEFVHMETTRPLGMEHFHSLLNATKNKLVVSFSYEKYLDNEISDRKVEPLGLKEFKSRWYLLCRDTKDQAIKTFALDRVSLLEITRQKFKVPAPFDVKEYYRYCFGIIHPTEPTAQPQQISLSFNAGRGKYIKSLPLHASQKVVKDTDKELVIALELFITYDLVMELLSFGHEVTVLSPQSLRKTMNSILSKTDALYKE